MDSKFSVDLRHYATVLVECPDWHLNDRDWASSVLKLPIRIGETYTSVKAVEESRIREIAREELRKMKFSLPDCLRTWNFGGHVGKRTLNGRVEWQLLDKEWLRKYLLPYSSPVKKTATILGDELVNRLWGDVIKGIEHNYGKRAFKKVLAEVMKLTSEHESSVAK